MEKGKINSDNLRVSPKATLFVVSVVQFLTPFMFSAVGVALPTIGIEFGASAVQLGLIEMVYILSGTLLLLPIGRFADIYGRKRMFVSGTVLITIATVMITMSNSIETFIALRFLQGTGSAMITSTSIAILTSVYPSEHRGQAMGIIIACVYMGLSAGPTLAGVMVTHFGWRFIFYAAIPVELAAIFLTMAKLKGEWAEALGERFDWTGSLLYMMALSGLVFGATSSSTTAIHKWSALGGLLGIILFFIFESRTDSPVLDVGLLRTNLSFTFNSIATWINYAASFGVVFFFSIYLQSVKGFSSQTAGFIMIIQPLIQAVFAPVAGRLSDKYPPARIAIVGMALCASGLGIAATLNADSSLMLIFAVLIFLGLGFGFFSTPNTTAIMSSVNKRYYGVASGVVATMRSMGMLTSMTIITIILSSFLGNKSVSHETQGAFILSMHTAFITFSIMSLAGIIFSLGKDQRL